MDELVTIQVGRGGSIAFEAFPDGVVVFRVTEPGEGPKEATVELTHRDLRGLITKLKKAQAALASQKA